MLIQSDPLLRTVQNSLIGYKANLLKRYSVFLPKSKHPDKVEIEKELSKVEVLLCGVEMSFDKNRSSISDIKL